MQRRIVVFTADLSHAVRAGIVAVDRSVENASWLVVVHEPRKQATRLVANQWRNLRRNGWRWIPYQIGELLGRIASREGDLGAPAQPFSLSALASRPNIRIERMEDLHSESTLQAVRAFGPELGLALASPILRESLFSIPALGTFNLHKGRLPQYRGMPPAFWELWNDEQEVGCTVHRVDDKLDTGAVICETTLPRCVYSDLRGLQLQLDALGIDLVRRAAVSLLDGTSVPVPQKEGGRTFRKPTLRQFAELARRIKRRMPQNTTPFRHATKEVALAGALAAWGIGGKSLLRPQVTVLLYHRVSDDARDNLTVGVAQFDRQMALLRRHCEVISLEHLLSLNEPRPAKRPVVSVTFDDGYLDNYSNAMPILIRHGIPAAFFVSTGIVGTEQPFPHDVRRANDRPRAMSWEQVETMHEHGFTIGSHAVSHIDCAAEPEQVVRRELADSLATLRRRLNLDDAYFAYPYGGPEHMTPQRLALVKETGYRACLSAYGGSNVGAIDPYNVLRRGIHWGFSDRAFLFQCLGMP